MFSSNTEKDSSTKSPKKNIPAEIANILDELITAFVMTLLVVIFIVRPYIIPTGSMADTLMGAHFRLQCPQCGYRYQHDFASRDYGLPENVVPRGKVKPPRSRCPSCGSYFQANEPMEVTKGDKILALKCIYQFFEPKRWDVVVFRSPLDPQINFIKRLVGRPGETVKIIDGDVYIDGQIARKPPKIQKELWMPVYDNDYQPTKPQDNSFNGHSWRQPFDLANSEWNIDQQNPAVFCLDTTPDRTSYLKYDTAIGNDFRATYAYNHVAGYRTRPHCSDLKIRFYARPGDSFGNIGATLGKYQTIYKAQIDLTGQMIIKRITDERDTILASKTIEPLTADKPTMIEFANADHRLFFQVGNEKLTYDLGRAPDDAGQRDTEIEPEVKIFGAGNIRLSHVAVFRDIYYTTIDNPGPARATENNPLVLREDEFFVLGDNSPISADGRVWHKPGMGNNGRSFRRGIVPREYLVGKAFLVFWPSGFRPFAEFPFACVPNIGRMRIIYGGSGKEI